MEIAEVEEFVALIEIKNVFMNMRLQELPTDSGYLEINDQIVYNYEKVLDQITVLKRTTYNKKKHEKLLAHANSLKEMRTNADTDPDYYIGIEDDINIENISTQLDIANFEYDNAHTLENEDEIKTNSKEYSEYINTIHCFLKKINYLYIDDKHILSSEILMSSDKYQAYLTNLFDEIMKISLSISSSRVRDNVEKNNNITKLDKNGSFITKLNNSFTQNYVFEDTNELRDKQRLLEKLMERLSMLIKYVKNTYVFLNVIINAINVNNNLPELLDTIQEKRIEYVKIRNNNNLLLPPSFIDKIKNTFTSTEIIKKNKLLEDYHRYISFWLEENKIVNDLAIYKIKESYSKMDYVNFIFGNSITDKFKFNQLDLYNSLYNSPINKAPTHVKRIVNNTSSDMGNKDDDWLLHDFPWESNLTATKHIPRPDVDQINISRNNALTSGSGHHYSDGHDFGGGDYV